MLLKSDVGNYSYAPPGSPLPHAVTAVSGGSISTTFAYDANGNQTSGLGRTISFTSYNKPASITLGARTISFLDDTEHQRFKQVTPEGATLYIAAFGVLAELQSPGASGQKWTDYLSVGNAKVGMRVLQTASATVTTRYFHVDNLGSISVITNENGVVQERLSYDAWGKRRYPNGTDDASGAIASQTTRGFTGEEELSIGGLVHLNGRIYDPLMGRMTSADPTVTDPMNPQGWNRYSYVGNDPLAFTDPNGFSWFSNFWHSVTNFFAHNAIARAILQIGANVLLNAILPGLGFAANSLSLAVAAAAAAGGAAIATGLSGGNLGQILKSAAIAEVTAAGLGAAGNNIFGNALVGCASSVASGGSCQSGALSAGVGAALGPLTNTGEFASSLILKATVGGVASVAGGGKFADGAVTGAFQYLVSPQGQADARAFGQRGDPNSAYAAFGATLGAKDVYINARELDRAWELSEASKAGGYIVQVVTITGADYILGFWPRDTNPQTYSEAWHVEAGNRVTDQFISGHSRSDDQFVGAGVNNQDHGKMVFDASAQFYEGLTSNELQNQGFSYGRVHFAHDLYSRWDTAPGLNQSNATVKRTFESKW